MSHEEPLNAAERELEAALGALRPSPTTLDRDRLMFEAGRRSARPRRVIVWQSVSGALGAALLLSVSLHRPPREVERIVRVPVEATTAPTAPEPSGTTRAATTWELTAGESIESEPAATSYLILRKRALSTDGESGGGRELRHGPTRRPTDVEPGTDLPDAGFFGRAPRTSRERL